MTHIHQRIKPTNMASTTDELHSSVDEFRLSSFIDRLDVMKRQEQSSIYHISDCLSAQSTRKASLSSSANTNADIWCRSQMVQWCYAVVDFVHFNRETVLSAMQLLDRFVSTNTSKSINVIADRRQYQLAAMTALYLAIKIHEPQTLEIGMMVQLGKGAYASSDFYQMEFNMLSALKWHLHGPTATAYLEHLLPLLTLACESGNDRGHLRNHAQYYIELSTSDYDLVTVSPSKIAVAAIINSLRRLAVSTHAFLRIIKELKQYTGIDAAAKHILAIAQRMHKLQNVPKPCLAPRVKAFTQQPETCNRGAVKNGQIDSTEDVSKKSPPSQIRNVVSRRCSMDTSPTTFVANSA
uniref:Cyclin N-terminal domain-containing protein n=1 Tax=Chaetoceros debilis TaxID=122233 RepID=A0A7S3Q287_9STRA